MRPCPACEKSLPFRREWATNTKGIIIGSLCPHCGARLGSRVPMARLMLMTFVGGVAIMTGVNYFNGSQAVEAGLVLAWMAGAYIWYVRRPLIVLPEDYNPYNL